MAGRAPGENLFDVSAIALAKAEPSGAGGSPKRPTQIKRVSRNMASALVQ